MTSNLKVNTILASSGDTVSIAGIASITSSVSIASSCTAASFFGDGSALTGITAGLSNIVEDTSPQLGANLDTNSKCIDFGDSNTGTVNRLRFGASTDLEIFHNGTNNYIDCHTSGQDLYIRPTKDVYIQDYDTDDKHIKMVKDGAVELYHNGSKKFETTNTGGTVTGDLLATGLFKNDTAGEGLHNTATGGKFYSSNSNDTRLEHGSNSQTKLTFYSTGNTYRGAINGDANGMMLLTAGSSEQKGVRCVTDGATELFHSGNKKFSTGSAGVDVSGRVQVDGHCFPYSSNQYDLGLNSNRWRNVYTNDLNLSNEGGSNDVDGTWGDYTIQEGESDLFLINNRNGKRYKFNLTEVL